MSTTPRSFEYPRANGTPVALLASTIAPLLSNVRSNAVALLGFQFGMPLITEVDANAAKCEPLGPIAPKVAPLDANLNVHIGERFVANFVNALSNLEPVCTEPVKNSEVLAELHWRLAFAAELLMRAVSFPVLAYFAIIPSR